MTDYDKITEAEILRERLRLMIERAEAAEDKLAKADNLALAIERRMVGLGGFDNRFGLRKALQEYYDATLAELESKNDER